MDHRKVTEMNALPPDESANSLQLARHILHSVLESYSGPVAVSLWNGETIVGKDSSPCRIIFRSPAPLRDMIMHRNILHWVESYMAGEVDIEGDVEQVLAMNDSLQAFEMPWVKRLRLLRYAYRLPPAHATDSIVERLSRRRQANSRSAIAAHYDVSNAFYRLWLDPEMVYSCAYFKDINQSLARAQQDKLDYICRKLRLSPGQSLLDIGCGWGGLVCWAARRYQVRAHGITLSEQQYGYALERVRRENLQDLVTIELLDYRDLSEGVSYDRIVSVGMFEHIGIDNFPRYFGKIKHLLKPSGLFLNHGITSDTAWEDSLTTRFINQYVFPDGELARLTHVIASMQDAGFEVFDVEGLRRHYMLTLRRWVEALESGKEQAVEIVEEATYRLWRFYMASCAYCFEEGTSNVFQVLAGHARQPIFIPLRRDDIYQTGEAGNV